MGSATVVAALLIAAPAPDTDILVGDRYSPGDEAVWVFEQAGRPVGTHAFRYEGPVELPGGNAHHFRSWTSVMLPGAPVAQRMQGDMWTTERGHLVRHVMQISMGEAYSRIAASFRARSADVDVVQGTSEQDYDVDLPGPVWHQANNFISSFDLVTALNPVGSEPVTVDMFSSNVLKVFPFQLVRSEEQPDDGTTVLHDSLGERLVLDGDGHLLRLEMASQKLVIRRTDEAFEHFELTQPEAAAPRTDFDSEDVVIEHGSVSLAGTITRPKGTDGPLPAVFFVSGSGGQDRNGFSSGIDAGTHEVLDRLTDEGFLVLRVDDRGVGQSTGPTADLGMHDLVADARACVDFLLARDDVDGDRVAVIGHSEGGLTAPIVVSQRPQVAALVLMAAVGRPMTDLMIDQNEDAMTAAGLSGEELAAGMEMVREGFALMASDEALTAADVPPEFVPMLANRRWVREHARHDPVETIGAIRCPVLVLQGALDFQVSVDKDAEPLAAALEAAGHEDFELVVFPKLDHLFKRVAGSESTMADYFTRRPVDAEFLDTLSSWMKERLVTGG